jgi:MFS family permease
MHAASGFGTRMVLAGLACLLHALLPFLFTTTGSRTIADLHAGMAARHAHPPAAAAPQASYALVILMCLAQMMCMPGFTAYAALLPRFRSLWSLANAEAGLVSGALFFGYALTVPFLTAVTDRADARQIYMACALIAACGSGVFALLVDGFAGALIAQILFGVGFAGIYMPGLKAPADRTDQALHSRAVALYTSLSGVGLAFAYFANGWIANRYGWRWAFATDAIGPLAAGLIALTAMRPLAPSSAGPAAGLRASAGQILSNRPALGFVLGYTAHSWELFGRPR